MFYPQITSRFFIFDLSGLSGYSVKKLDCNCGIVLTASHNPPEYNGYKIYWKMVDKLFTPDSLIASKINSLDYNDINFNGNNSLHWQWNR